MKRFLLVLLLSVFLPLQFANAQLLVLDAAVAEAVNRTGIDQIIHFGQMIAQQVQQVTHLYYMGQNMVRQYQMALQNMRSAGDIGSWSDFMDWYNRQLYLERRTIQTFDNMNVTIGNQRFHFTDIEGMRDGIDDTFIQYWDRQFTEEQRREMWLGLGLTPANYAFRQTFAARQRDMAREFLALTQIQNEQYQRNMERNYERQNKLAQDHLLAYDDPNRLTQQQLLMYLLESSMENNRVLNDMAVHMAMHLEFLGVTDYLNQTINEPPPVMTGWQGEGFRPLTVTPR